MNKYNGNSWKWCVDLEYSKEIQELHNHYYLAPDKVEIQRETLSEYELNIADLYNISINNVKKLVAKR